MEEYVNLIYDFIFYKGINKVTEAFREGFNIVFNINELKCFTSEELEEVIFGSDKQKWENDILYENLKPEHGYTKNSKIIKNLKINRETKYSIKSIFINYWDEFVSLCKMKNMVIRPAIIDAVEKMIHCMVKN